MNIVQKNIYDMFVGNERDMFEWQSSFINVYLFTLVETLKRKAAPIHCKSGIDSCKEDNQYMNKILEQHGGQPINEQDINTTRRTTNTWTRYYHNTEDKQYTNKILSQHGGQPIPT